MPTTKYPHGFLWGVATAAYQVEGAVHEDWRGEMIWDRFCRVPGAIRGGDTGDVACDYYTFMPEDTAVEAAGPADALSRLEHEYGAARDIPAGEGVDWDDVGS